MQSERRVVAYKLLVGTSAHDLETAVHYHLQGGWQPWKGPFAYKVHEPGFTVAQAMVQYEAWGAAGPARGAAVEGDKPGSWRGWADPEKEGQG